VLIIYIMSCNCNYNSNTTINVACRSCLNLANPVITADQNQRRIWRQVRVPASQYLLNLGAFTSSAQRVANGTNTNWNTMSDRVLAANQTVVHPSHGSSTRNTLTSGRPGAASPGGRGVDVKHDSYARFLNRKKAKNLKTQTTTTNAVMGNKTKAIGLVANNNCCV